MTKIFISYRRVNSEGYVGRLYDQLVKYFDKNEIFLDVGTIRPGEDFAARIEQVVGTCDALIVVIGPQWVDIRDKKDRRRLHRANDWVRPEIASALKRNILVIPALVERASMPEPDELPGDLVALTRRNAIELSHDRFEYDVKRLVDALGGAFGKIIVYPVMGFLAPHKGDLGGSYRILVDHRPKGKITSPRWELKFNTPRAEREKGLKAVQVKVEEGVHTIQVVYRSENNVHILHSNELRFSLKGGQTMQFQMEYKLADLRQSGQGQLILKPYKPVIEA